MESQIPWGWWIRVWLRRSEDLGSATMYVVLGELFALCLHLSSQDNGSAAS